MKAPTKQKKIVQDAEKFIRKYELTYWNEQRKKFRAKDELQLSESELKLFLIRNFELEPDKRHHAYINDLIKQIKFFVSY
jgi:hypothetical protein